MSNVFVIAEAGISHDGDLDKALALIDVARTAGADAVKFQTFNAQKLAARRKNPDLFAKLKPYEMPLTWLPMLKEASNKAGIEFMTTCFDEETLKIVAAFVKRFKIGHGEVSDQKLLDACEEYGKPIIRSIPEGAHPAMPRSVTSTLYVTRQYPTPTSEAFLSSIRLGDFDGFSDHTRNVMMGSWAVAAGAKIVEVHFCDWYTNHDNPDRCVSHCPTGLIQYVDLIRQAELAVYGADSEETKKLERPGSAPRTSRPPESGASALSGDLPAA